MKYLTLIFLLACSLWMPLVSCTLQNDQTAYYGFTLPSFPNSNWSTNSIQQYANLAVIKRTASLPNYSIFVEVAMEAKNAITSVDEVESYIRANRFTVLDTNRYEFLTTNTSRITKYGVAGVEYYIVIVDKNAPNLNGTNSFITIDGFSCLHPYISGQLFTSYYREDALADETNYSPYVNEANQILSGIKLQNN